MSQRSKDEILADIQIALAEELLKRIKSGEGSATDLNVARQFLKDNEIQSVPGANKPLDALKQIKNLPTFSDDQLHA